MTPDSIASLAAWISEAGLAAADETPFLADLCTRARAAGLTLSRATVFVDTLHPIYEGRVFRGFEQQGPMPAFDHGPTEGENLTRWQQSYSTTCSKPADAIAHRPARSRRKNVRRAWR